MLDNHSLPLLQFARPRQQYLPNALGTGHRRIASGNQAAHEHQVFAGANDFRPADDKATLARRRNELRLQRDRHARGAGYRAGDSEAKPDIRQGHDDAAVKCAVVIIAMIICNKQADGAITVDVTHSDRSQRAICAGKRTRQRHCRAAGSDVGARALRQKTQQHLG